MDRIIDMRAQQLRHLLDDEEAFQSLSRDDLQALLDRCQEVGLVRDATHLIRRLIDTEPDDREWLQRGVKLLDELGDVRAAAELRRCLAGQGGVDGAEGDDDPHGTCRFSGADLARFVDLFAGREDVHARQWYDRRRKRGGYSPVHEPLTPGVAAAHLAGRQTVGSYLVRHDDTVRQVVLDLDVRKESLEAAGGDGARAATFRAALDGAGREICDGLAKLGIPHLFEDSGYKGRHWWVFFDVALSAEVAQALGNELTRTLAPAPTDLHMEVFPKQSRVQSGGLGNLVKLPLGVHQASGRRSSLLLADGSVHPSPLQELASVRRLPSTRVPVILDELSRQPSKPVDIRDARTQRTAPRTHAPPLPPFTEADLRGDPDIAALLEGCPVLARVVGRVMAEGQMDYDMQVALRYTLGHLEHGPQAFNFLADRCGEVAPQGRMGRPQRGSPTSCANLRRRLPGVARRAGCDCDFGPRHRLRTYPSPLLHVGDLDRDVRLTPNDSPAEKPTEEVG